MHASQVPINLTTHKQPTQTRHAQADWEAQNQDGCWYVWPPLEGEQQQPQGGAGASGEQEQQHRADAASIAEVAVDQSNQQLVEAGEAAAVEPAGIQTPATAQPAATLAAADSAGESGGCQLMQVETATAAAAEARLEVAATSVDDDRDEEAGRQEAAPAAVMEGEDPPPAAGAAAAAAAAEKEASIDDDRLSTSSDDEQGAARYADFAAEWRREFPFTSTGRQWGSLLIKAESRSEAQAKVCVWGGGCLVSLWGSLV